MKTHHRTYLLAVAFLTAVTPAMGAQVKSNDHPATSCEMSDVKGEIYFPGASRSKVVSPSDEFHTPKPSFIVNAESEIDIWYGNGGAADCTEGWYRASNYSPGNHFSVNALCNNNCRLIRNSDPLVPFAQIVFRVAYKEEAGVKNEEKAGQYFYYATGSSTQVFIPNQRTRVWGESRITGNACVNYFARWCGDGIVSHEEKCDPGPNTSASSTCSQTCELR